MKSVLFIAAFFLIARPSHQACFCSRRFAIPSLRGRSRCERIPPRAASINGMTRLPMAASVALVNETEHSALEEDAETPAKWSGVGDELQSLQACAKPRVVFGTPPPAKDITRLLLKRSGKPKIGDKGMPSLTPQPVSAVGSLRSVRHLSKSLCVCELVPPTPGELRTETSWAFDDSKGMTVQLLLVGDLPSSVDDFFHSTVLVRGSTIVDKKESLKNWAKDSQLDVKVLSIQRVNETVWNPIVFPRNAADAYPPLFQTRPLQSRREGLRFLRLSDLYPASQGRQTVVFVDALATIELFAHSLSKLKSIAASGSNHSTYVGIDCEWKPDKISDPEDVQPVLLLQISLHDSQEVYLLDLQALLRPLLPPGENLNSVEEAVSALIFDLFHSSHFIKVGFQLVGDLRRLAASYPHMKCFGSVNGVLEVSRVARKVMRVVHRQRNSKFVTSSLGRLVEHLLQMQIDKEQQCSDWSARPLSAAQREYAALDAVIAPHILSHAVIPEQSDVKLFRDPFLHVGRWVGDASFVDCVTSWEFTPAAGGSATLCRGEGSPKRKKRHQRLFGNLPPVVTYRKACGPGR